MDPSLSGQERRAATSAKHDGKENDKDPSRNHHSESSTSSADNEKAALIMQIGYQSLTNLRLDAATWQKHVDIRKGMKRRSGAKSVGGNHTSYNEHFEIAKPAENPRAAAPGKDASITRSFG